jgi:hypothetical protein
MLQPTKGASSKAAENTCGNRATEMEDGLISAILLQENHKQIKTASSVRTQQAITNLRSKMSFFFVLAVESRLSFSIPVAHPSIDKPIWRRRSSQGEPPAANREHILRGAIWERELSIWGSVAIFGREGRAKGRKMGSWICGRLSVRGGVSPCRSGRRGDRGVPAVLFSFQCVICERQRLDEPLHHQKIEPRHSIYIDNIIQQR